MVLTSTQPLSPEWTDAVLAYLGVEPAAPTLGLLDTLLEAYTRTVPWESAFRIARRTACADLDECARFPETFWRDALERGGGGTCFESNYAFFALLRALGYDGYLTINNMGDMVGCHTAIVVLIDGQQWLADVGMPLYAALPIDPYAQTERTTPFFTYTVEPLGSGRYDINRAPHPDPNCFTLIDTPVGDADYRAATIHDYGEHGYFLTRVIVTKIVGSDIWRFDSSTTPAVLQRFDQGERTDYPINGDVATAVGEHFGINSGVVRVALAAIGA